MSEVTAIYYNGLGDGRIGFSEAKIFNHLRRHGVEIVPAHIDWHAKEPFNKVIDRLTKQADEILRSTGSVALIGASAGGSMALNVFGQLNIDKVKAVNLSGRLHEGDLPSWDSRKLKASAHYGTNKESQLFYDSVIHCYNEVLVRITEEDKQRIVVVKPWMDFVVPLSTMDIDGVDPIVVPGLWHQHGIGLGLLRLPGILGAEI